MALIVLAIILIASLISKRDFCSLKLIRIQLLPKFIDVGRAQGRDRWRDDEGRD